MLGTELRHADRQHALGAARGVRRLGGGGVGGSSITCDYATCPGWKLSGIVDVAPCCTGAFQPAMKNVIIPPPPPPPPKNGDVYEPPRLVERRIKGPKGRIR